MSQSHFQPFHKGKIKIKNEVVPLGLKINSNNKKLNRYIFWEIMEQTYFK